jgi:hypothetical protein
LPGRTAPSTARNNLPGLGSGRAMTCGAAAARQGQGRAGQWAWRKRDWAAQDLRSCKRVRAGWTARFEPRWDWRWDRRTGCSGCPLSRSIAGGAQDLAASTLCAARRLLRQWPLSRRPAADTTQQSDTPADIFSTVAKPKNNNARQTRARQSAEMSATGWW